MNDVVYMIIRVVVVLLATFLSVYVVPFLKAKVEQMTDAKLLEAIKAAVQAAEQTMIGGEVKKEEVVRYMQTWLQQHHINITMEQLDKLIESAVYALKQAKKTQIEVERKEL